MSTFSPQKVTCRCGHELEIDAADSLHISDRPEIRASILSGDFHTFICPACGGKVIFETLLAYTDFHRWHWFTVFPSPNIRWRSAMVKLARDSFRWNLEVNAPPLVRSWAPSFQEKFRVIFGLHALREKLIVFDAGLDDRVVEVLKLQLILRESLRLSPDLRFHLEQASTRDLLFAYRDPIEGGPNRALRVDRDLYEVLAANPSGARRALPELFDDIAVDYRIVMYEDQPLPPETTSV
jgi:hypothetical protein